MRINDNVQYKYKVSVIVPVYNVEKYIAECMESILAQTIDSYEIICIDDASMDKSINIVEDYAKMNNRIKIIHHEYNRGLSAARNTGIEHSEGKYIFFLDSDDMIIPESLEELYSCAEQYNLDEVYFNMKKIYEPGMEFLEDKRKKQYYDYKSVYDGQTMFELFIQEKNLKIEAWRQFFKKDFIIKNNIAFYEDILHEDNLFSFLCAMKAKRVMNINKEYYLYRQRNNSIMSTLNAKRVQSMYIVMVEVFKYWNEHTFPEHINRAIYKYFEGLYRNFIHYRDCCENNESLSIGTYAEKSLYALLTNEPKHYATLSKSKIDELKKTDKIIIYGAGRAAKDIIQILEKEGIDIYAVAVNNVEVTAKTLCGLKVRNILEFIEESSATLIIGVTKKYHDEVKKTLLDLGFLNLISADEID